MQPLRRIKPALMTYCIFHGTFPYLSKNPLNLKQLVGSHLSQDRVRVRMGVRSWVKIIRVSRIRIWLMLGLGKKLGLGLWFRLELGLGSGLGMKLVIRLGLGFV